MPPNCNQLSIPDYLHQNGREPDPLFEPVETLFRRFFISGTQEVWKKDSQLSASIFEVKDDSVLRSKYCKDCNDALYNEKPEDAGKHYLQFGVLELSVGTVVNFSMQINGTTREFTLKMNHSPTACIYPHSEIWVFENGIKIDSNKPKSVKVAIRQTLLEKTKVLRAPTLPHS